jgi:D-alanyl-D-alanine dipeptidase
LRTRTRHGCRGRAIRATLGVARLALLALGALGAPGAGVARGDPAPTRPAPVEQAMARHPGLVDAATVVPELQVDLRYATADNFLGRAIYGALRTCYLQQDAARMLARAQALLIQAHPDWRLRVLDCARPLWVQREMWKLVKGTPKQGYVADPAKRSVHNFGCAVDLTVATRAGAPLDMGTGFDFFGALAQPAQELALLEQGRLGPEQVANRLALREVMLRAGFRPLGHEWWHFDCASHADTRRRYREIP